MSGKTPEKIIEYIENNSQVTIPQLAKLIGVTERTIERNIQELKKENRLKRIGSDRGGHWKVMT